MFMNRYSPDVVYGSLARMFGRGAVICLLAVMLLVAGGPGHAATTEVRDEVRGVTYYSTAISTDMKTTLQAPGGLFSSTDVVTIGLSAFFFDESSSVNEYVVWLRHDGPRRWFVGSNEKPMEIHFGEQSIEPKPSHRTNLPEPSREAVFIEKLQFAIAPETFQSILDADKVEIEVRTLLGTLIKPFTTEEVTALRQFAAEVQERHASLRAAL